MAYFAAVLKLISYLRLTQKRFKKRLSSLIARRPCKIHELSTTSASSGSSLNSAIWQSGARF